MKILLAIDTSPTGQLALERVAMRPWPIESSFEVLSIIEPTHAAATVKGARELVRGVGAMVEEAVACLRSKGWETTGGALVDDDPKVIIIDRARTIRADLLVVGSHSRSRLGRFLLGSVALAVLRYAPCSVEIVRSQAVPKASPALFRVLFATDGSECSALAAESIAQRPWPAGTEVRILSAAEINLPARRAFLELPFLASAIEDARAEGIARSRDAVATAKKVLAGNMVSVSETSAEGGAKNIILAEATEWRADLIVLGSHGWRGFDRFQLGSVSEAVAMHAPCSVEIVRKRSS